MTRRYLLVDDNKAFAENIAEILTDVGAQVVCASDGDSALAAVGGSRFDALVTDMKMPGVSGAELLRRVRERDPGLPVVLVSAYTRNEQLEEARRLGLLAFIAKGTGPAELVALLSRARRDAVVVAATEDEGRLEQLREGLSRRGITMCSVHAGELPPIGIPLAILDDGCASAIERLKARFPSAPVLSAKSEGLDAKLEGLCAS
ncbi:MAG: response regulator [Archangium sp.]